MKTYDLPSELHRQHTCRGNCVHHKSHLGETVSQPTSAKQILPELGFARIWGLSASKESPISTSDSICIQSPPPRWNPQRYWIDSVVETQAEAFSGITVAGLNLLLLKQSTDFYINAFYIDRELPQLTFQRAIQWQSPDRNYLSNAIVLAPMRWIASAPRLLTANRRYWLPMAGKREFQ